MHIISILCLILLVPYVVIALAFMPKGRGKQLFNMVYSALALGGVGGLVYVLCRQMVAETAKYPYVRADILDTILACLFLMIPVIMGLVILNMVLKRPKNGLLFFIAAGLAVADGVGVILYSLFTDSELFTTLPTAIPTAAILVPLLCALAAGGLLPFEGKLGRAVHWTVQSVLFLAVGGLIGYGSYALYSLYGYWDISLLRFTPLALAALVVPGIPLLLFFYDMVKRSDRPARLSRKQRRAARLASKAKTDA